MLAPTDQAAQQDSNAERNRKQKERDVERSRSGKAVAARVAELEALKEQGPLTVEQEAELAELQPKVAQQKQKQKEKDAKQYQARKAVAARVAELEALKEQGPLTVEQEAELAELQPKVAQQKQKKKERNAKYRRSAKDGAARFVELEALKEQGPLAVEQEAELAEFQAKVVQQKQKKKEGDAKRYQARKAAAARVVELEALAEQGPLTVEQEAELAEFQAKVAQQKQKKEGDAKRYQARKAAAARVVELEALAEQGPLTSEQEAELAELQPKVAQQKQKNKERVAEWYQASRAAADRVVELEELAGRGPLTVEQEAELAELQPKVAHQKEKQKGKYAKRHRARMAAADRVVELEALKEQGPLRAEQEAELAELQPKVAHQKQKRKEKNANHRRVRRAAADRFVELEALKEQGPLRAEQEAELAELQPKVAQQKQKKKEENAKRHRAMMAAAARVVELEALKEQGRLTVVQEVELAELRPKAQQWQKKKESAAHRARRAAARVAELEELKERGQLTDEQETELAELRPKVAGRDKKVREVTETGVGGAPVSGRGVGLEGVSGWAGVDQVDWDGWSADVDVDAWLARAVPDEEGVQVPQGAVDAGVMLGGGAYEEFVATELLAFLGQDAGDDVAGAAVLGRLPVGLISPVSSPTTPRGRVPLGCLRVKALTGCFSVSRLRRMRCGRMRGYGGVWGVGGCRSGTGR